MVSTRARSIAQDANSELTLYAIEPSSQLTTTDWLNADTNTTLSHDVGDVVATIENILETIVDSLSAKEELSITFLSRRASRSGSSERCREQVKFPGQTIREARKFARVLLILQLSHDALVSGTVLTKRHIYYQHQDLFESQRQVDDLVDDLAFTLGVNRGDLNIVATSKGLVAGPCTIRLRDGNGLDVGSGGLGMPIPTPRSVLNFNFDAIRWILIIEKDAIYRSLCSSKFWLTSTFGPGVLVTGKGYPDLLTRGFLHKIHASYPELPLLALVDYDPYGINILHCYRYGSQKLGHEIETRVPSIRWLGIKSSQLMSIARSEVEAESSEDLSQESQSSTKRAPPRNALQSTSCREPISYLTLKDRAVAIGSLKRLSESFNGDEELSGMRRELQVMMVLGAKAEIEWLDDSGSLCAWLDGEIGATLRT